MAVSISSRRADMGGSLRNSFLPFLVFSIAIQGLPALCRNQSRDWTTCSNNIRDGPLTLQQGQGTCSLASDWSPWSQHPWCPEPLGPHEDDSAQRPQLDCVFTLSTFRGNQGISLITTPDLAASVVESLDDSRVSPSFRHHLSSPGVPPQTKESSTDYEIRDIPGRGKGVVAKRRFAEHQTIMVGFPVLVVRLDFLNGDGYTQRQKRLMMEAGVRQLPPEQERAIKTLARNTGGEPNLDVLRTNGFGIEIEEVQHLALFVDGSRVNHNCRPNSFWRYTNSEMGMEVVALRDIGAGEEITHSYAPLGHTFEERKAVLQAWGFRCRCALCSAGTAERDLSDSRRERLREIYRTLGQAEGVGRRRVAELVRDAMTLIEQEDLAPQLVEYYQQFARAFLATDDLKSARRAISEADRLWRVYGGEEHENVDGIRELWQALREAEQAFEEE